MLLWVGVAIVSVTRVALSLHSIALPGIQQDETLFVNAATLRIPGLFLLSSSHGIPVTVYPYIGALKSWIYAPVFTAFGTDPTTIRMPAVLISTAGIVLVYPAVGQLVNRSVAAVAFATLAFDNSVFWLTRDDVGPSAIEFALKCTTLFCAAYFARTRRGRWLIMLLASLALGVFNKLNFIWVVNAVVVASMVVIVVQWARVPAHIPQLVTWIVGMGLIYGVFGWYYVSHHIGTVAGGSGIGLLSQPWSLFSRGTSQVLSGTWFYDYALGPQNPRMPVVWIVIGLFALGAAGSILLGRSRNMGVGLIALTTVLIAIQNLLTQQATAGWHYIAIYPFVTIVSAYGVYVLVDVGLPQGSAVRVAMAVAGVAAVMYSAALLRDYEHALHRRPMNAAWSPAIYRLSHDLRHVRAQIFTTDWGILEPLFALNPGRQYTDLTFDLTDPAPAALQSVAHGVAITPGPKLLITHATGALQFPVTRADLFRAMGPHLHLAMIVSGPDHEPIYDVYRYR